MAIADKTNVSIITGIDFDCIEDQFLTMADNYIKSLLNRDFNNSENSRIEYIDLINRNDFVTNYDRVLEFILERNPVTSVTSVISDPDNDDGGTVLTVDDDYFVDLELGSIKLNEDLQIQPGQRKLKVIYKWGYADAPDEVKDFANWYSSFLIESRKSFVTNSDGAVLKEVEIGRYREAYGVPSGYLDGKYKKYLDSLENIIEQKYKIWD